MLILHYLIFKNNYVVHNFSHGMLCYVTISTSSHVSMIDFIERIKMMMMICRPTTNGNSVTSDGNHLHHRSGRRWLGPTGLVDHVRYISE